MRLGAGNSISSGTTTGGAARPALAARLERLAPSEIASGLAICAAAVLLAALGLGGWWLHRHHAHAADRARLDSARVMSRLLADSAATLLVKSDGPDAAPREAAALSQFRRGLSEVASSFGFSSARLVLPDGSVLAHADPKKALLRAFPEPWPSAPNTDTDQDSSAQEPAGSARVALIIPGRGAAAIEVQSGLALSGATSPGELFAGLGTVGVAGLMLMLGLHRLARRRLRGADAIRSALLAAAAGEEPGPALRVAHAFGPEAHAWNNLLDERERLRTQLRAERALDRAAQPPNATAPGQPAKTDANGHAPAPPSAHAGGEPDRDIKGAVDALWQGLVLLDDQMRIKHLNGAAAVFLGVRREAALRSAIDSVISDESVLQAIRGIATRSNRNRVVVEVRKDPRAAADGTGTDRRGANAFSGGVLRFSIKPVRRDDPFSAVMVIEDITQQRAADEARNSFVAQATHELRTPLTTIRLYVDQLLEEPGSLSREHADAVNVVSAEARRLERIVADMLSVAQIEAGSLALREDDVRLAQLLADLKGDFAKPAAEKPVELVFDLPPKLPVLKGDRDKLMLCIHNLLGNAVKYTPAGGKVSLRAVHDGPQLLIEVADNGIGIKPEEHELIFEKFYRAKDRRIANITGTGLGLALAREVARLHGGDITVASTPDKGSTFTLRLPAPAGSGQSLAVAA